jgi:hypothetical protein
VANSQFISGQGVDFAASGAALLHWTSRARQGPEDSRIAWWDASTGVSVETGLASPLAAPPVRVAADRVGLLVQEARVGGGRRRVRYAAVRVGERPGRWRTVANATPASNESGGPIAPAIAVRRGGTVAVAWTDNRTRIRRGNVVGKVRLQLALARSGRRFSRPRTVATRRPFGLGPTALTYDRNGALIVVFAAVRRGREPAAVFSRQLGRRGRFGPARAIGPADPSWGMDLHAATGRDGTVAVAWGSRPVAECFTGPNRKSVFAAVRPRRTRAFQPVRRLATSPTNTCDSRTVGLVVGTDGRSTVAWSLWDDPQQRAVHVAELNAHGRIATNERLASGDFGGLAAAPDGATVVSWDDSTDPTRGSFGEGPFGAGFLPPGSQPGHALAALRPPGSDHFGVPERVSGDDDESGPPSAAVDPRTGAPLLMWFSYPRNATSDNGGASRVSIRSAG